MRSCLSLDARSCVRSAVCARFCRGSRRASTKQERAGIVNFTKVDAVVACGGATETTALDGLQRTASRPSSTCASPTEASANIEAERRAREGARPQLHHIPFNGQQPDPKAVDQFLGDDRQQGQPAGLRALRLGQPRRLDVAGQARAAGRLDGREGHRRSEADRPARRAAREVRARLHRQPQEVT